MKKIVVLSLAMMSVLCMSMVTFAAETDVSEKPLISIGDYNENVIKLHQKLSELGYYSLRPESPWGPDSVRALKIVQGILGWEEPGVVEDADQWNAILATDSQAINIIRYAWNPRYQYSRSNYIDGIWRAASGGSGVREIVEIDDSPIDGISTGIHVVGSQDDGKDTDVGIDKVPVEYGCKYIMSCYARGQGILKLERGKTPFSSEVFDVNEEWKLYSIEFTVGDSDGSTVDSPETNIYFGVPRGADSDITICGMRLFQKQED